MKSSASPSRSTPTFDTVDQALRAILGDVMTAGELVAPRGLQTREVISQTFCLTNPRARLARSPTRKWSEALAIGEWCWHLRAADDVDTLAYYAPRWRDSADDDRHIRDSCYGRKIFAPDASGSSQWQRVVDALRTDPSSRRAVLALYDATQNPVVANDVACITTIQFMCRDGNLHCFVTMRSNDAILGLPYDIFFVSMLQEMLALELGVTLGRYYHTSASLHVYQEFFDMAETIAREEPPMTPPMLAMSNLDAIPRFLRCEERIRAGIQSDDELADLPAYWRGLAVPLVRHAERRRLR